MDSSSTHSPVTPSSVSTTANMPITHTWSIAHGLTIVSEYPSRQRSFETEDGKFTDELIHIKHSQKLDDVKHVLSKVGENTLQGLIIIDALQRLGIDYHFQEDIEAILHKHYLATRNCVGDHFNNLYEVSLGFRLLRQQGYHVPPDVFEQFKDDEGVFKEEMSEDIKGLMALYEAAQLSIEGEEIVDEAASFSCKQLNSWLTHVGGHQGREVRNTLEHPHHKTLARFMMKNFLKEFKGNSDWENVLREFAELDFLLLQSMHKKEVIQVLKWWKELGLAEELKFVRDQPLKWYIWPMAVLPDSNLSDERIELTKPISLVYIIDDIFDVHGTLNELTLFTEAVNKWDIAAVEQLPDYMKVCFKGLYDITNQIGHKVCQKHGWNPIDMLQKAWASLCNAFLVEAKWFGTGHIPKAEEYLRNGVVSSGVHVVLVHLFCLLGHAKTKEIAELVNEGPSMITSAATILRLWDDLGSAEDENQEGHDGSYLQCYMKEHQGSSVEVAKQRVNALISDAWKRLNQDCLFPNPFSPSFTNAVLNVARMVPLMYSYDDNHGQPILQQHIKQML